MIVEFLLPEFDATGVRIRSPHEAANALDLPDLSPACVDAIRELLIGEETWVLTPAGEAAAS
jgi:hypothetical protein